MKHYNAGIHRGRGLFSANNATLILHERHVNAGFDRVTGLLFQEKCTTLIYDERYLNAGIHMGTGLFLYEKHFTIQ